ncbi:hypothetical protein [Nocardia terpenica]|uniref:Uncharacterized protein n=1 Tax=Nocardia terpenica TaxID=455432 RepID=A0A164H9L2_9NOCA|nr:hypothetical protein [Nocardia terpenica]KZM68317.1 hypothetical protein AWN90_10510 [Nocardia terpenica]NQE88776.1 hypothetical protein [Nocardia terpenica]
MNPNRFDNDENQNNHDGSPGGRVYVAVLSYLGTRPRILLDMIDCDPHAADDDTPCTDLRAMREWAEESIAREVAKAAQFAPTGRLYGQLRVDIAAVTPQQCDDFDWYITDDTIVARIEWTRATGTTPWQTDGPYSWDPFSTYDRYDLTPDEIDQIFALAADTTDWNDNGWGYIHTYIPHHGRVYTVALRRDHTGAQQAIIDHRYNADGHDHIGAKAPHPLNTRIVATATTTARQSAPPQG